jgi:predicted transcriptional regulator
MNAPEIIHEWTSQSGYKYRLIAEPYHHRMYYRVERHLPDGRWVSRDIDNQSLLIEFARLVKEVTAK